MKKIVIAACALICTGLSFGQGGFLSFNVGYGLPAASDLIGTSTVVSSDGNFTTTPIYGSFGTGLNIELGGGYMISQNFGIELAGNYLKGGMITTTDNRDDLNNSTTLSQINSFQVRVIPSLVLTTANEKFNVYGKTGLVLPLAGVSFINTVSTAEIAGSTATTTYEAESMGAFTLGYSGAIGASFGLTEKLSLFGEIKGINLRVQQESLKVNIFSTEQDGNVHVPCK